MFSMHLKVMVRFREPETSHERIVSHSTRRGWQPCGELELSSLGITVVDRREPGRQSQ